MYKPLALLTALYIAAAPDTADARDRNTTYSPIYTVRRGDTLRSISIATGIDQSEIRACNPQLRLKKGNRIRLYNQHTVKEGDSLSAIAWRYTSTLAELVDYNPTVRRMDVIYPGQKVAVPCHKERTEPRRYEAHDHNEGNGNGKEKPKAESRKPEGQARTVKYPSGLELTIINDPVLTEGYYRDPANRGIPLVQVPYDKLFERVSKHFTLAELIKIENHRGNNELHCVRGNTKEQLYSVNGDFYFKYARLDPKLVELLEKARVTYGKPLYIEEGYRPPEYNTCSGSTAKTSPHMSGIAADVNGKAFTEMYRNSRPRTVKIKKKDRNQYFYIKPTRFPVIVGNLLGSKGGIGYGKTTTHIDVRKGRWRGLY